MDYTGHAPGQDTGVGRLFLLQGIFPTQGSNPPGLLDCRQILYQLSHKRRPRILEWVAYPFSSGSSWLRNRTRVSCIAGGFFTNWAIREAQIKFMSCKESLCQHVYYICVCVLSRFSHVRLFVTPWPVAHQDPLSMGFSRQEYWSRFPCPPPGDLPDPGIKPTSLISPALAIEFFTTSANWEARVCVCVCVCIIYFCPKEVHLDE